MAAQRIAFAKIAGEAAGAIHQIFLRWLASGEGSTFPDAVRAEIDDFATNLRANAATPPVVYFNEWVDMWSMGNILPSLGNEEAAVVGGNRFQAGCHVTPIQVDELKGRITRALSVGAEPAQEATWLVARLSEAQDAWDELVGNDWVLVVLREALGPTATDVEIQASLQSVPKWLDRR